MDQYPELQKKIFILVIMTCVIVSWSLIFVHQLLMLNRLKLSSFFHPENTEIFFRNQMKDILVFKKRHH